MGRKTAAFAASIAATAALILAAPAGADEPGCERVPILGLNPQVRSICDGPIQPDGSWARARRFSQPGFTRSSCDGVYYQGGQCPWWNPFNDGTGPVQGGVETYIVTADTIPPGEPGYIGG